MKLPKKYLDMIPHYTYKVEWDAEDKIYVVSVEELPGCMTHGETQLKALEMGHEAVQGFLESMYKHKEVIPLPFPMQKYKGEFLVRATPELHKKLADEARDAGFKTLNKYIVSKLAH
jgi:predicted RNase H-like HicB family nuclease